MTSSKAAQAMWPNLARKEAEREAKSAQAGKVEQPGKPSWGNPVNDPMWSEPRAAPPKDFSRVPHLRRISK
jgi:hypothetical protein